MGRVGTDDRCASCGSHRANPPDAHGAVFARLTSRHLDRVAWPIPIWRPWIRRRNLCEFDDPIKPHRNISSRSRRTSKTMRTCPYAYPVFRIAETAMRTLSTPAISSTSGMNGLFYSYFPTSFDAHLPSAVLLTALTPNRVSTIASRHIQHIRATLPTRIRIKAFTQRMKKAPACAGASSISRNAMTETQNVMLQLSIRPVSALELSVTRSRQLPFSVSVDRFTM